MSDSDDLQKLLRLKRYERPPDGYFERFAEEFKERQRAELLHRSARVLLMERVSTWIWTSGTKRWFYAGGATSTLLAAGYLWDPFSFGTDDSSRQAPLRAPESLLVEEVAPGQSPPEPAKERPAPGPAGPR